MIMNLNGIEILEFADSLPTGIWDGKAGLCLYLAENNSETVWQLWKKVMQDLRQLNGNIDFCHGLTGIVFAAYKLEEKGLELADLANLTAEVDSLVFREVGYDHCNDNISLLTLTHLVCFEAWLISEGKDNCGEERDIRTALLKNAVNLMLEKVAVSELYEPPTFSLEYALPNVILALAFAYKCGVYKKRIERTMAEMSRLIIGRYPLLHANRLFMLFAVEQLCSVCKLDNYWKEYKVILEESISIETVLDEVKGSIYIADGVSGVFWLLRKLDRHKQLTVEITDKIRKLIDGSNELKLLDANNKYRLCHLGLFNGLAGVALTEKKMKGY